MRSWWSPEMWILPLYYVLWLNPRAHTNSTETPRGNVIPLLSCSFLETFEDSSNLKRVNVKKVLRLVAKIDPLCRRKTFTPFTCTRTPPPPATKRVLCARRPAHTRILTVNLLLFTGLMYLLFLSHCMVARIHAHTLPTYPPHTRTLTVNLLLFTGLMYLLFLSHCMVARIHAHTLHTHAHLPWLCCCSQGWCICYSCPTVWSGSGLPSLHSVEWPGNPRTPSYSSASP